ncbi:MAG: aspartyl/glutamyl-tRNA amidotransferase subunit C [Bacilli bacterium]|nr:aspartyl/glutamyl-tRNA amidotransferase subunit C [Bacilli bacterium]
MITRVLKEMMKTVNKEILKEAANKLMFDMEDSQYQTLLDEFDVILERMELISEIPGIDDALPMTFPFDVTVAYMREDVVTKPLSQEEALKNAGDVVEGQIRLPKVVG